MEWSDDDTTGCPECWKGSNLMIGWWWNLHVNSWNKRIPKGKALMETKVSYPLSILIIFNTQFKRNLVIHLPKVRESLSWNNLWWWRLNWKYALFTNDSPSPFSALLIHASYGNNAMPCAWSLWCEVHRGSDGVWFMKLPPMASARGIPSS